ncbi:hypothetical protein [Luethyella okanaganae]|uniref:Uncharacterized protein n=1 Tax=Luethyella okanaganae TaxID=69372 RepID=A0ABW1VGE0_9MICO
MSSSPPADRADRADRAGFAFGVVLVVAGGLVAAATGPLELVKGGWLAAYLVLVCGVAQCCLAVQDRLLVTTEPSAGRLQASLLGWNAGNVLVIGGVLAAVPIVVDVGGILLVAVLVVAAAAARHHASPLRAALYRVGFGVLIVSVPIGLTLAHLRAVR